MSGKPSGARTKGNFLFTLNSRKFWQEYGKSEKIDNILWEYLNSGEVKKEMFAIKTIYEYHNIPVSKQLEIEEGTQVNITAMNEQEVLKLAQQRINNLLGSNK